MKSKMSYSKLLPFFFFAAFVSLTASLSGCGGSNSDGTVFQIKIKNISGNPPFTTNSGQPVTLAFSSLIGVVSSTDSPLYTSGVKSSIGLEQLAENGNPGILLNDLSTVDGIEAIGVANEPSSGSSGILTPGQEFTLIISSADPAAKLHLATASLQSNDTIIATPELGVSLFDQNGSPVSGDISTSLVELDAGTEANQPVGLGSDQILRQSPPTGEGVVSQGTQENGVVERSSNLVRAPSSLISIRLNILSQSIINPSPTKSPEISPTPVVSPTGSPVASSTVTPVASSTANTTVSNSPTGSPTATM